MLGSDVSPYATEPDQAGRHSHTSNNSSNNSSHYSYRPFEILLLQTEASSHDPVPHRTGPRARTWHRLLAPRFLATLALIGGLFGAVVWTVTALVAGSGAAAETKNSLQESGFSDRDEYFGFRFPYRYCLYVSLCVATCKTCSYGSFTPFSSVWKSSGTPLPSICSLCVVVNGGIPVITKDGSPHTTPTKRKWLTVNHSMILSVQCFWEIIWSRT